MHIYFHKPWKALPCWMLCKACFTNTTQVKCTVVTTIRIVALQVNSLVIVSIWIPKRTEDQREPFNVNQIIRLLCPFLFTGSKFFMTAWYQKTICCSRNLKAYNQSTSSRATACICVYVCVLKYMSSTNVFVKCKIISGKRDILQLKENSIF